MEEGGSKEEELLPPEPSENENYTRKGKKGGGESLL